MMNFCLVIGAGGGDRFSLKILLSMCLILFCDLCKRWFVFGCGRVVIVILVDMFVSFFIEGIR